MATLVTAGLSATTASAAAPTGNLRFDVTGTPDVALGIDGGRLDDSAYVESLSLVSEKVSTVKAAIAAEHVDLAEVVDFGVAPGTAEMIVYWSGSSDAPALKRMRQLANAAGLGLVVAQRTVGKAQIDAATTFLESNMARYAEQGIALSAFGGFSADFDGVVVHVDSAKSQPAEAGSTEATLGIEATLDADLGVPTDVTAGGATNFSGKYDDFAPFNGGGLMVGSDGGRCTTGFGVVLGASKYRYLSARHCDAPSYTTESRRVMGGQELRGAGYNGAAVFSAGGSTLVFDGSNVGNPTSTRTVTQRDPALSTVGTVVCQEGANMGQKCGVIRQVAMELDDKYGTIRVNYVRSVDGSIIAAGGDSGAAVISQHTQQRAWAVGILQGGIPNANNRVGAACGARDYTANGPVCSDNFVFTNIDYALSGFTGYAIRYS
ncbi:hypothetical protein AB0K14_20155 [Actinosynnema sp. NPDC050801]|uniref:hypothetical protein n=1 Tax=unclassified Actinosynnema TaxID=2637065 RepID=UPI0033DEF05A